MLLDLEIIAVNRESDHNEWRDERGMEEKIIVINKG